MTLRRSIGVFLLALFVLLMTTAGVGWYLLGDEAFLKSQSSRWVSRLTDRELTFKGPLSLKLGSITSLEARDVYFSNANWAQYPEMASVGHILITFELASLLGETPTVGNALLEDCRLNLEESETGEANWNFWPDSGPESESTAEDPEQQSLPVWVKNLIIRNCRLEVSSSILEQPLTLRISEWEMQLSADSKWQGTGSGRLNDLPLSLNGRLSPFNSLFYGGPLAHDLKIRLGEMSLSSSGSLQDSETGAGSNISTRLKGLQIENVLQELELPLFSAGDFDFTLDLNTEGDVTKLELSGDMGSLDVSATGELDQLISPAEGNLKLTMNGPNLGALAKIFGIDWLVEDSFVYELDASMAGDNIVLYKTALNTPGDHIHIKGRVGTAPGFAETELDVDFDTSEVGRWADAFGLEESVLGRFAFDSILSIDEQGLIAIQGNAVQADTTLSVEGTLGSMGEALQPDLDILLQSPNPGPLASVWGFTEIPSEPLTIQGRFSLQDKRLEFENMDVRMAASHATVDGALNLDDRFAGSDFRFRLNIENAEKLGLMFGKKGLPNQPIQLNAEIKPEGKGLAFTVEDGNHGEFRFDLAGRMADLQQPLAIDGDFDISLPRLGDLSFLVPGRELPNAPFTARGHLETAENRVNLDNVIVDLAGNQATLDGHLSLVENYAGSKITFNLDIDSVNKLGKLFAQEGFPNQPLKLTASIEPAGKGLAFQLSDGNLGEIQLEINGKIADLDSPAVLDAEFEIKLQNLSDIAFLLPGGELPQIPFTASGRLVNVKTRSHLDQVQLTLGQASASVNGDLFPDNSFQLRIEADGPDASKIDKLAGIPLPPEPFSLATELKGNPSALEFQKLNLVLGKSQAKGDLTIGLGAIKTVKGHIDSPYMDLNLWTSDYAEEKASDPPEDNRNETWMFDNSPTLRLAENSVDIDLNLKVDTLSAANTIFKDIALEFQLSSQLVKISPFTFRGETGDSYRGNFSLDETSGTPTLHLDLFGKDVRLGLAAASGQDPKTYPPIEIELNLDGAGETSRDLVSSLNGRYVSYFGSGLLANDGMDVLFSDFLTQLFSQINPFSKTSEYTELDCAVVAAAAENGTIRIRPLIFHTKQLTILSEGIVDMNTEDIDIYFRTKPRTGLGLSPGMIINPLIKLGGRLTTPAVEIDPAETITTGGLAVATIGISLLAQSMADRFLSSTDPCGDARKAIEQGRIEGITKGTD